MRILFITNNYPPFEIGGYEQLCRDVAVRLQARGHAICILTSTYGLPASAPLDEPDVRRELLLQPDYASRLGVTGQFFLSRRRREMHNLDCLRRAIDAFRPDVIFIWNLHKLPRSITLEAERQTGIGVAYWLADRSPAEPDEYWSYWSTPARRPIARAIKNVFAKPALALMRAEGKPERPAMQHVAVVSDYFKQKNLTAGLLPPQTEVIYNGLEIDRFFRPVAASFSGPLHLLQAGRVSVDKGVHVAVEAVGRVVRDYGRADIELHIAGSGPDDYAGRLRRIAAEYGVEDKIIFHGWLPREQLPALMAQMQVLLLPSEYPEAFARVVLEAMASGLTVVGTLTGGTGEILKHEQTGLTFKAGDSVELAQQIVRLVDDPALRIRLARCGQAIAVEQFDLDRMVERCERLLEQARFSVS